MHVGGGRLWRAIGSTWAARRPDTRARLAGLLLARGTHALIGSVDLRSYGRDDVLAVKREGRRVIFVGWHGHDLVNIGVYHPLFGDDARGALMVPDSYGGDVLTHMAQRMNLSIVSLGGAPGSAQSARAVVAMIKLVRGGHDALLAVDGPAGPARQVKPGAALIAQRAGAVLVPVAIGAARALTLGYRWDDHVVPLPRTRVAVHFGPLIDTAPPQGPRPTLEELQRSIGEALTAGTRRAEALGGKRGRGG